MRRVRVWRLIVLITSVVRYEPPPDGDEDEQYHFGQAYCSPQREILGAVGSFRGGFGGDDVIDCCMAVGVFVFFRE